MSQKLHWKLLREKSCIAIAPVDKREVEFTLERQRGWAVESLPEWEWNPGEISCVVREKYDDIDTCWHMGFWPVGVEPNTESMYTTDLPWLNTVWCFDTSKITDKVLIRLAQKTLGDCGVRVGKNVNVVVERESQSPSGDFHVVCVDESVERLTNPWGLNTKYVRECGLKGPDWADEYDELVSCRERLLSLIEERVKEVAGENDWKIFDFDV